MIDLRPKLQFQRHEDIKRELAQVVQSDHFQFALSFAVSEFVATSRPSADQLAAVQGFIRVLLNLPLADDPLPQLPQRTIDQRAFEPHYKTQAP